MSEQEQKAASEGGIGQSASTAGLASKCSSTAEERYLRETLAMLHDSYAKAAKPYIDRLVAINAMRQPAPMIVTLEQAQDLGLMPANAELKGASRLHGEASLSNDVLGDDAQERN